MRRFAGRCALAAAGLALSLAHLSFAKAAQAGDAGACEGVAVDALAEHLPQARRFVVADGLVPPLVELWPVAPELAARLHPDGATIFARDGLPLLVALTRGGCVVGAFEADRALLWRRLREALGPAI